MVSTPEGKRSPKVRSKISSSDAVHFSKHNSFKRAWRTAILERRASIQKLRSNFLMFLAPSERYRLTALILKSLTFCVRAWQPSFLPTAEVCGTPELVHESQASMHFAINKLPNSPDQRMRPCVHENLPNPNPNPPPLPGSQQYMKKSNDPEPPLPALKNKRNRTPTSPNPNPNPTSSPFEKQKNNESEPEPLRTLEKNTNPNPNLQSR